jgi:hypothetical protein
MWKAMFDLASIGLYVQTLIAISQLFFYLGLLVSIFAFVVMGREPAKVAQCFGLYFLALLAPPFLLVLLVVLFKALP